jgi:nicotinate-nucleotide pyrophosphorylase (carboxylating)
MKFKKIEFLKEVLREDIGRGDLARFIVSGKSNAVIKAKQDGILAGVEYIKYINEIVDIDIEFIKNDGDEIKKGDIICKLSGDSKDMLSCERSILDIFQHASGIATNANKFVKLAQNKIKILDTRKTRPLLREFEKYSAKVGGVTNHRLGLDDCLMLKDTHLALFNSITEAINQAREKIPFTTKIEVECETFKQAKEAIDCKVDIIMCDNMDRDTIKKVVEYRNKNSNTLIEASGNITLNTIEDYIELGVDAVSSGSIIHQATFLDFSMKMENYGK